MEYGKLIEEGDHKSLMEKRGRYYELFSTQAKRYMTDREREREAEGMGDVPMGRPPMGKPPMGKPPFDAPRAESRHPDIP